MDEIFINVKGEEFEKLFTRDFVSLEEFKNKLVDLMIELERKEEELNDEREQREEFYKPKSPYEVYGVSEKNFI